MIAALASLAALLLSVAILVAGNGLQGTLIAVRANLEGFPAATIGALMSAYYVGFVSGSIIVPGFVRRVGHIRTFAALAAVAAASAVALALFVHPVVWWVLRVVTGFCFAGLYTVFESWVNERASNENRGRVFSVYKIIDLGANTLGQLLLTTADPRGFVLFSVVSILICLALVPVALTTAKIPRRLRVSRLGLRQLYRASPLGVFGCFALGLGNSATWGLAPVFVQEIGQPVTVVAYFMSLMVVGGAASQWPIGFLSDRYDRRLVTITASLLAAASGVALTFATTGPLPILLLCAVLFGGLSMPVYSLCVAYTNDYLDPRQFVAASSALLLLYGVGAIIGPFIASLVMQELGGWSLFLYTATVYLLLAVFGLFRTTRRTAVPPDEQAGFVAVPRPASAVVYHLDPRSADAQMVFDFDMATTDSESSEGA